MSEHKYNVGDKIIFSTKSDAWQHVEATILELLDWGNISYRVRMESNSKVGIVYQYEIEEVIFHA